MRNTLLAAVLALVPLAATAEPQQCLGRGKSQWLVDNTFLVVANPEGFENQLRANICLPLYDTPGLLLDYAQFETGFFNYVSPVYVHQGAYVSITPLSFLQFRADVAGVGIWPLPIDGAGYFGFPSYTRQFQDSTMPAKEARWSGGLNATFYVNLQGEVPITSRVSLIATNSFAGDYWYVGDKAYYFNPRRDLVLQKSDWVVKNTGFLLAGIKLTDEVDLRVDAVDDLTWVPRSGYFANILSGFVSVPIRRNRALRDIEPFLRLGAYTDHGWRTGPTLMAGVSVAWALPTERTN